MQAGVGSAGGELPSADPTPDLLALAERVTADPHVSTGTSPGVGVIKVRAGGRDGTFESVAPVSNIDATGVQRADVHALSLRLKN